MTSSTIFSGCIFSAFSSAEYALLYWRAASYVHESSGRDRRNFVTMRVSSGITSSLTGQCPRACGP